MIQIHSVIDAHPWVTAECTQRWKAFEAVLNSGVWAVMKTTPATHNLVKTITTRSLETLRDQWVSGIIAVYPDFMSHSVDEFKGVEARRIFGPKGFHLAPTILSSTDNNLVGLRVNQSHFIDTQGLYKNIDQHPDHVVMASIPYSDPSNAENIRQSILQSSWDTIAARTLGLITLNDKEILSPFVQEETWFIWMIENIQDLIECFQKIGTDARIILKVAGGQYAGGTSTFPIQPGHQSNLAIIEWMLRVWIRFCAFEPIRWVQIHTRDRKSSTNYGHIRPIIVGDELLGACLKFPQPVSKSAWSVFEKSLRNGHAEFNSSSGTGTSIIVGKNGEILYISEGKTETSIEKWLQFQLEDGWNNLWMDIIERAKTMVPFVQNIKSRVADMISIR